MKRINWDDLRLFLHVAEAGGLSGAARQGGVSPATVGRRILALEAALGVTLFTRSARGYALTKAGGAVLERSRPMLAAARALDSWRSAKASRPVLRISAGTATAAFLADRFSELWHPDDAFQIAFVTTEARLDIAHREIDIGIRNSPPESGNLASRPLQTLRFAPFRNRHAAPPAGWVAVEAAHARHPAALWVLAQELPVSAWATSVATVHELVRGGAGIGVMPCLLGDADPSLTRAGPLIDTLTERQHLITHNDDRHRPELRELSRRLAALFARNAPLLAGERPMAEGASTPVD
ncbi:LysR family transcriptional regulator [Vannielia sp.]|uniref:LysR family transcriptional regulator n=1 Tax=Vannielia sp. TaxID=2813045 RepID=UPI0026121B51|nr:LysR family transcriptional regulator [Vannielia sp.]MDF1872896.1 LysR family transcriptional regulator [Vannielia sp.]